MFNTNNKNNQSEDQESSIGVSPTSDEVYIMPEKFHAYPKKSSSNKSLFVVVLILVLVVVISASYFIYNSIKNREVEPSQPVSNQNNNNTALGNTNTNSNANANTNVNRDANRNSNINNANENTNANENSNQNSNANTNTNENTNRFIIPTKSTDTDRDGLTDLEEALIGSSTTSPDSDRDGYLDSDELLAGYNPIVNPSSGESFKLEDADFIDELITNFADDNFRILYIKGWSVNLIESLREVRIITATGETKHHRANQIQPNIFVLE